MPPDAVPHPISTFALFASAAPLQKAIVLALLVAIAAALTICALKLLKAERLPGGSAFLSGLRLGGPILGALSACDTLMHMMLAYASLPDPSPQILAIGFAQCSLQVGLGFLAGAIAVFANWTVASRIDRQILAI